MVNNPAPTLIIQFDLGSIVTNYYVFHKASRQLEGLEGNKILEHFVVLKALYSSVVLGLCRLADWRRRTWSFQRLADALEKSRSHTWRTIVQPAIDEYYAAVKPLQDEITKKGTEGLLINPSVPFLTQIRGGRGSEGTEERRPASGFRMTVSG